jgi:hypothetical protein
MAYQGLEEYRPALQRIKAPIEHRLGLPGVTVIMDARRDHSTPPRGPETAFVEFDGPRGRQTITAQRLLFAARCEDPSAWTRIDKAFGREGFEPFGPRADHGEQVYQSTRWASLIVEEHPGATMAIERTGKAMVGRIQGA